MNILYLGKFGYSLFRDLEEVRVLLIERYTLVINITSVYLKRGGATGSEYPRPLNRRKLTCLQFVHNIFSD